MEQAALSERTALKEWTVLVDAMARGEIMVTVRKGGIREQRAGFSVRHDRFLLYPTRFHEKTAELAPRFRERLGATDAPAPGTLQFTHYATVGGVWAVQELDALRPIEPLQGLTPEAIASRFHYRGKPGVQVVALRVYELPEPKVVPEVRRYAGCVSWVALDEPVDLSGAKAVVSETEFTETVKTITEVLGESSR